MVRYFLCCFLLLFLYNNKATGQELTAVRRKLEGIRQSDQVHRLRLDSLLRQAGKSWESREVQEVLPLMARQDSLSLEYVRAVLSRYGWLGIRDVDTAAKEAIFLVIQHADSITMRSAFPLLVQSYETGGSPAKHYALMLDRLLVESNREQVYGTQMQIKNEQGVYVPFPIADKERVDDRRRKIGLPPLQVALEEWK